MVFNTLDGSLFFCFIFKTFFFFQCQGSNPVLVHAGRVICPDLHPQTQFSSLLASPEMAPVHSWVELPLQFQTHRTLPLPRPLGFTELQSGGHNPQKRILRYLRR